MEYKELILLVDDDIGNLHLNSCDIVNNGGDTCHTTCGQTVGQHEHGHAYSIKNHAHSNEGVIL